MKLWRSALVFLALSLALHLLCLLYFAVVGTPAAIVDLELPKDIEFGLMDGDPGTQGAPAPSAPPPPVVQKPKRRFKVERDEGVVPVVDAGAQAASADVPLDAAVPLAVQGPLDGDGAAPFSIGEGLGFGAGGFGSGLGGPLGAIIGLHVDLDAVRRTSLVLEIGALLAIIPQWQRVLEGSGIDPLRDFSRLFVASPTLKRSSLVISARFVGGEAFVLAAARRLAQKRGAQANVSDAGKVRIAPWYNPGPTERVLGLLAGDQFVIARPDDVARVLVVSAALAQRNRAQSDMERAEPPAALLSMYKDEAVALSVEGVRAFVPADQSHVPLGVRFSLQPIDEVHAALRAFGYYESGAHARAAVDHLDELRKKLLEHPQVSYLGLRAAIQEATFSQEGATVTLHAKLTMHHVRYLTGFVSRALSPRD